MVDAIGSSFSPSVQAVNKARGAAQEQKSESSEATAAADEVSLSAEAQELSEVDRLASEARELLVQQPGETLSRTGQQLNKLL